MASRPTTRREGGNAAGRGQQSGASTSGANAPGAVTNAGSGAQHVPTYLDSTAEYISVRRSDLREISTFGLLEHGTGAVGMFFISGAFWLAAAVFIEHSAEWTKYFAALGFCLLSVIFGLVLVWVSYRHFALRRDKIDELFKHSQ